MFCFCHRKWYVFQFHHWNRLTYLERPPNLLFSTPLALGPNQAVTFDLAISCALLTPLYSISQCRRNIAKTLVSFTRSLWFGIVHNKLTLDFAMTQLQHPITR